MIKKLKNPEISILNLGKKKKKDEEYLSSFKISNIILKHKKNMLDTFRCSGKV